MPRLLRTVAALSLSLTFACAYCEQAYLNLSTFPSASVADGRSTVTVSAEIRDGSGDVVPDGTRVFFSTTLGTFRESIVETMGGIARAVLVAGGTPGVAKITASCVGLQSSPAILEFEFVGDRRDLSNMQDYIEIVAPSYMQYTNDTRIIAAAGPNKGVSLRFRDIEVDADDIQVEINSYELRARKAHLKMGRWEHDFDQLYLHLDTHRGLGTTSYTGKRWNTVEATTKWIALLKKNADGSVALPKEEDLFGVVDIRRGEVTPSTTPIGSNTFEFEDLSYSPSSISAKKAIVFPRKEIQFQKAEVYVAGTKVMKLPLYELNLAQNNSPLVTDDFLSVQDNQINFNYPYYLSLKPGETSLLRLRMGGSGDRGMGSNRGLFLDYQLDWNRGDRMQGAFNVSGIARNDWIASLRQYFRFDDYTDLSAQIQVPGGRSVYGNVNLSRQFQGFSANLNANANHSLRGVPFSNDGVDLAIEKDPTKVGRLPVQLFYGLVADSHRNTSPFYTENVTEYGARLRAQSLPVMLSRRTSLMGGLSVSRMFGSPLSDGLVVNGSVSLAHQISDSASLTASYDYTRDGFNDALTGRHQLTLEGYYSQGKTDLSLVASRALDIDRVSFYGDLSYRLSDLWRLSSGYTLDRYLGYSFVDYNFAVGYRIGWREVGITWSRRTNRIGVQLFGASF